MSISKSCGIFFQHICPLPSFSSSSPVTVQTKPPPPSARIAVGTCLPAGLVFTLPFLLLQPQYPLKMYVKSLDSPDKFPPVESISRKIKPKVFIVPFWAPRPPLSSPYSPRWPLCCRPNIPARAGLRALARNAALVWDTLPCIPACLISSLHLDLCADADSLRGRLWPIPLTQSLLPTPHTYTTDRVVLSVEVYPLTLKAKHLNQGKGI